MDNWGFLVFAAGFMGIIWLLTRLMTSNGRDDGGSAPAGPTGM